MREGPWGPLPGSWQETVAPPTDTTSLPSRRVGHRKAGTAQTGGRVAVPETELSRAGADRVGHLENL